MDLAGNAYTAGQTNARDFPPTGNAFQLVYGGGGDGFVSKLNSDGSGLISSSYLGGRKKESIDALAVDAAGVIYATGWTTSKDFPTRNTPQATRRGSSDAFIVKIVD